MSTDAPSSDPLVAQATSQSTTSFPANATSTTTDGFTSGNPQTASASTGGPDGAKNVIESKMEAAFGKEEKDAQVFSGSGVGTRITLGGSSLDVLWGRENGMGREGTENMRDIYGCRGQGV